MEELAGRHPGTKFRKSISTDCIPNYPDANLPTVLVYHDGACAATLVGLGPFGGRHVTPEQAALVLNTYGPVCRAAGAEEDEQGETAAAVRGLVQRMVDKRLGEEGQGDRDESSDFDG